MAKHISFFFNEARLPFINRMLAEAAMYSVTTDIFIHVNRRFCVTDHAWCSMTSIPLCNDRVCGWASLCEWHGPS